jgi:hypothetical protein
VRRPHELLENVQTERRSTSHSVATDSANVRAELRYFARDPADREAMCDKVEPR